MEQVLMNKLGEKRQNALKSRNPRLVISQTRLRRPALHQVYTKLYDFVCQRLFCLE